MLILDLFNTDHNFIIKNLIVQCLLQALLILPTCLLTNPPSFYDSYTDNMKIIDLIDFEK